MIRPVYITKRWSHHTSSGGYDRIARLIPAKYGAQFVSADACRSIIPDWVPCRAKLCSGLLAANGLLRVWGSHASIVHVLYAEEHLGTMARLRGGLRRPVVGTFHLPATRLKQWFLGSASRLLRNVDAAIVVSRSQQPVVESHLGAGRVAFIPHGIDTDVFCPDAAKNLEGPLRIVSVGSHMRDWTLLRDVICMSAEKVPDAHFDIVTPRHAWSEIGIHNNATMHEGLSESELIELYRRSHVAFIPVTDATANNAALEAMACGTPVLSRDVGGMADYVQGSSGWLYDEPDPLKVCELLKKIANDRGLIADGGRCARETAMQFDWSQVVRALLTTYQRVMQQRPLVEFGSEAIETSHAAYSL